MKSTHPNKGEAAPRLHSSGVPAQWPRGVLPSITGTGYLNDRNKNRVDGNGYKAHYAEEEEEER
ncbi:hypothetical protein EYF80_045193 [Liparis tanakae]|uniref:Uncharacterized protein n=1 Tax=Liparis tanakae TaxID=230148 RepID=A0A4Z2FUZ0_9TELE|nr:hypothetical protein EYF80_045193 [Liparis tanakae]